MTRVKPVEGRKAPLLLKSLNWASRRRFGREMLPLKLLGHNPRFLLPYTLMSVFAQGKTDLPHEVRLLAMHLVAEMNGCTWCIDFGMAQGIQHGIPIEKLTAVRDYAFSPLFMEGERAALAFAEEMTHSGGVVGDATFEELGRHFSERQIVELAAATAVENFFNRLNAALGVEAEGFCSVVSGNRAS